jgi:drug/metabolite transporter (DMT)-like permease
MNRSFWNIVPRPVKVAASVIIGLGVLIGLVVGIVQAPASHQPVVLSSLFGICIGLFSGCFVALWVICLGYVYADARDRGMPPILWTLLAALVPNLLGFLFYFALRRPLLLPCPRCRQAIYTGQRFCASCGFDTFPAAPGTAPAPSTYTGLGSNPV